MSTTVPYTAQAHRNKTKEGGGTVNKIERAGRFSLGLILGLLLVALLVWLSLAIWRFYITGDNQIMKNDPMVLGKCCLVRAVPCCAVKKPKASAKQKNPKEKAKAKQTPQAVVVEEILPRAVVIEQSIPTAVHQSVQPSSLLDGVDPDFGKTTVGSNEDREMKPRVRGKRYLVRQSPSLYYGGCPYRYGCEYRNTYTQYGNTYPPQVIYGGTPTFVPNPPVIVPAPSVTTPAGTYGR